MPIQSTHPLYDDNFVVWTRCRDCTSGADAIKDKGETYLPKLSGQSTKDYDAYKLRANFVGVASRAISGLVGMVIRRSPTLEYPAKMQPLFTSSIKYDTFTELFQFLTYEILLQGRVGVLIDIDDVGMAYTVPYRTESIISWKMDGFSLSRIVLSEYIYEENENDQYEFTAVHQLRELYLDPNGVCNFNVYVLDAKSKKYTSVKSGQLLVKGKPIDFIPFVGANALGISLTPVKPPMLDIVDVNMSHYRTSADLENGRHFVSLPTPVVTGVQSDSTTMRIGSETAWILPSDKAKAFFLEFQGQGLGSLEKALEEKMAQMTQFSARLIDLAGKGSEAAETVKLRYSSESANLSTTALVVEQILNNVYDIASKLVSLDPNTVNITLNKEFLETKLTFQELRELVKAYIDGGLTKEELNFNLHRGEMLPPEK